MDGNLRQLFRKHLPHLFWTSIETGSTGRGIPDSHCIAPGGTSFWVEFKQTSTHAVGMRPEQVAWLTRYARMGGRCWVAVRRAHAGGPRKGPLVDELYLYHGANTAMLKSDGIWNEADHWSNGPARWAWDEIEKTLLR